MVGAALVLPLVGWTQRWNMYDTWRLRGYAPPPGVVELAAQTTMTEPTKRLFYVYYPSLDDKQAFNNHCSSSEQTIVLGCYVSGRGIYLFNVTDPRISGIKQVTAAHEMLHAAYERLSNSEKRRVDNLINQEYAKVTDERIRNTIADYQQKGADITNELHSILGTEVRTLQPGLEEYYKRYFTDRLQVVTYSEQYEQVFTARKQQIADADKKLESIKQQIGVAEAELNRLSQQLQGERTRLDNLLANNDNVTYNAAVPGFNARVNTYNARVRAVRSLIDQHNVLVADRNAIVTEEGELVKAIDTRPDTIEQQ